MRSPATIAAALLTCFASAACGPQSTEVSGAQSAYAQSATPRSTPAASHPRPVAEGSRYDYYILNLSWSPEFCYSHPTSEECPSHPGFVVHGLWPERNDGSYPEHCGDRPGPSDDYVWAGLMPTSYLAMHEWQTHGTCTPYAANDYFGLVRRAVESVKIPKEFTHTTQQIMEPPDAIIAAFARINTSFPDGGIVLSCGNNRLTAMEFCFDKGLSPIACSGLRTCRANNVKITPQISSQ
jgi:ribonuclease T2